MIASRGQFRTEQFNGAIAGIGTTSGWRLVIGMWPDSPLGVFSDVMAQSPDGHRILLAPSAAAADFVSATYQFDEVRIERVELRRSGNEWVVKADSADIGFSTGKRGALGHLLALVPRWLAVKRWWARLRDPIARVVMPGVRTIGTAGGQRREWYSALDLHQIIEVSVQWEGQDLGELHPVSPPVGFGFGSTPSRPSLVRLVSTVQTPVRVV